MGKVTRIANRVGLSIKNDGMRGFAVKARNYTIKRLKMTDNFDDNVNKTKSVKDILFVCGCPLPHPQRYRVDHQIEQLEACGLSAEKMMVEDVCPDDVKYYRAIIIFRCPVSDMIRELIKKARYFNKRVFYDIDDLVIDTKYTDKIEYLDQMSPEDRKMYDADVRRMGETMKLCDYCITTTKRLAKEMESYGKEVYINKNVASEEMVMLSQRAMMNNRRNNETIRIGYLSGSITHNPDFRMIMPAITKIMKEYSKVQLVIIGYLDLPNELEQFRDRIINKPFCDWRKLPEIIASLDINLAPIEESVFNEAKSENKWTEAALCKVVTVASKVGAFDEVIEDGVDGLLCTDENEWYEKLKKIITEPNYRTQIAEKAYEKVMKEYTTINTGVGLSEFIKSKMARNIAIIMPATDVISGGVLVGLKHCDILRRNDWDVTAVDMHMNDENVAIDGNEVLVINGRKHDLMAVFDKMIATMYTTLDFVMGYPKVLERGYLVQSLETEFYKPGEPLRIRASATYNRKGLIKYLTISEWCEKWLKDIYGQKVKYAPNGIETKNFRYRKRQFKGKIKILVEGNSESEYKNIDESFRIIEKLDADKYEIIYLSYGGGPKDWYRVDKYYNNVPFGKVNEIYRECDILLKSSILESFSYPPLEMMATGGFVVARPNEGNVEYLKNGKNCLLYDPGNMYDAIEKIEEIVRDKKLREKLNEGAKETVAERDWKKVESKVLELYL